MGHGNIAVVPSLARSCFGFRAVERGAVEAGFGVRGTIAAIGRGEVNEMSTMIAARSHRRQPVTIVTAGEVIFSERSDVAPLWRCIDLQA